VTARIVALVNQKGGVGKRTTAVSLAAALGRSGRRVLIVDLDPQANATSALGQDARERAGIYEAIVGDVPLQQAIVPVPDEHIALVPSSPGLSGAEVELVSAENRERRLAEALAPVRGHFDLILIDCPPSLGLLTLNALVASGHVIIPVQCEYMALEGLSRLIETLERVRQGLGADLEILGIVLTMYDVRTRLAQDVAEEVQRHFPQTFETIIPRVVRLGEAPSFGQSIFRYEPGGRAAQAYTALAAELLARVEVAA
jgi:chromosome partitioning protein